MVRSKTDGGSPASLPQGQTKSGPGRATETNPKNASARRLDVNGLVAGQGGAALLGANRNTFSDEFPGGTAPNMAPKGTPATEPGDSTINRGYTAVTDANIPAVRTNVSANRQRFGIDPGSTELVPETANNDGPVKPRFGVGGTG